LRIAAGNNSAAVLKLKEAMVSDLYLFSENAISLSRTDRAGGPNKERAGTRHFRTVFNISSFDGNATPDMP
jgi:hypothetical protein